MYAQQASINPALAALMQTAQMVTPSGDDTVAAQVAQAATQKLQPQGIAQGMPQGMNQVRQDVQAAMPSVARNAQEAQMRQALQLAMQPKPAGIEGLASNIRMAEGGVVGYAGDTDGSYVVPRTYGYAPDYEEAQKYGIVLSPYDSPEVRQEKLQRIKIARETGELPPPGEKESASSKDAEGIMKALKFVASPVVAAGAAAADVAGLPINLLRKYSLPGVSKGDESLTPVMDMLRRQVPAKSSGRGEINPPMAASEEGQKLAERMSAPTQFALDPNNPQALNALRRAAMTAGGKEREDLLAQIAQMQAQVPPRLPETASATSVAPAAISAPAAPSGIAAVVPAQPTLAGAMSEVEKIMPGTGTEQNRKALEELQAMRRARPASGIGSLAALQEEAKVMADLKAKEDASAQERGIMAWLAGRGGRGASAQSYMGYQQNEQQRQKLFAQENTIRAAKIDAITDANEARKVGDQEKYVEALNKLSELDRADKQVKAQLAGTTLQAQVQMRSHDIQALTSQLNKEAQLAQHAAPTYRDLQEQKLVEELMRANPGMTYPEAVDQARGSGKGMDLRGTSVELRALKDEEQQLLKRLEATFNPKEREPIIARLDQLSKDRVKLMGGTPTSAEPSRLPPQAVSQLKEGVVTTFANGQQWTLRNGQPTQVK